MSTVNPAKNEGTLRKGWRKPIKPITMKKGTDKHSNRERMGELIKADAAAGVSYGRCSAMQAGLI